MKHVILILTGLAAIFTVAAYADDIADRQRSYTTSWQEGTISYRSIMFPHEIDGCKVMVQSRRSRAGRDAGFHEMEGPDCNCDLVIDGYEGFFGQATGYTAEKLLEVCERPGLDGTEERYTLMREGLKEEPKFTVRSEILGR